MTYTYQYDKNGNIKIIEGSDGTRWGYIYDSANQLIRENNKSAGKTWVWTYDNAGNILSKKVYDYTLQSDLSEKTYTEITYTYGNEQWGDLLTGYNGNTITYTTNGNPLNDGTWKYTWRHGRQLELSRCKFGRWKWRCSQSERM